MIGVSPAFVVSLYGPNFSVTDFCQAMEVITELGFKAFQPEIFVKNALGDWHQSGAKIVSQLARDLELKPTQFVAHFMHAYFSSPETLAPEKGIEPLKKVIEITKEFEGCQVLTIPVLPLEADFGRMTQKSYDEIQKHLVDKIDAYLQLITAAGLKLAFEIVPFSVLGNADRLLAICNELNTPDLGINLDTGHAWANRQVVSLLPYKLKGRIFGTHLKDNNSDNNLPLAPGKGTIDWKSFLANLKVSGYTGSLDIEIGCHSEQVRAEYKDGYQYLQQFLK